MPHYQKKDVLAVFGILLFLFQAVIGKIDKSYYCGACLAIVEEVNHKIKAVDPNKQVEVGSFRVDPKGKQKLKKVPYARSDIHLTEVFETVCSAMGEYGVKEEKDYNCKIFPRTNRPDATPIDLIGVEMNEGVFKKLESACHDIVEDHEDDFIKKFKDKKIKKQNLGRDICLNMAKLCTGNEILAKAMWDKGSEERKIKIKQSKEEEAIKKAAEEQILKDTDKTPAAGEVAKTEL